MATGNYLSNLDTIYSLDNEEMDSDSLYSLRESLTEQFSEYQHFTGYHKFVYDNNLSFPAGYFGEFSDRIQIGDAEIELTISLCVRAGYYEGGNLDVEIDEPNIMYNGEDDTSLIDKMAEVWVEDRKNLFLTQIETVYAKNSTPLKVVARFSNGETIYQRKKSEKSE